MSELSIEKYDLHKVRNDVYSLETDDEKYIIKTFNNSGLKKKINNFRSGKVTRFDNEIKVYELLETISFKFFNHPKLIKTDNETYIVCEYIKGKEGWDKKLINQENLIAGLLEFQFSKIKVGKSILQKITSMFQRKIPNKIICWSLKLIDRPVDFIKVFKLNVLLLHEIIFYKPRGDCLFTHNDLFRFNNMINTIDGCLYIYDFEFAMLENKWFLIDIYDLSFDLEKLELDIKFFSEYIKQLSNVISLDKCIYYLEKQTRIILIRKILGVSMTAKASLDNKEQCKKFIKEILLNDKKYDNWYTKNIVPICEAVQKEKS